MKLALVLTALAFAVSSTVAIDCRCFRRCGDQSRHCYGQLQHKQRECRNRCHNNWNCYRRCVDDWVHHCDERRRDCLRHCDDHDDHRNNRCFYEVMEPINVMPEEIEVDEESATATPTTATPS